jgi:catechol 2,3-dioxygenase-like lactoylglutathione lyase family enzyme
MCFIFAFWALYPVSGYPAEIDFTRYLAQHNATETAQFFGVNGDARIIVTAGTGITAIITLNGEEILGPGDAFADKTIEIPVTLISNNTLSIDSSDEVSVRVKQRADIELNVFGRIHFNTNVSDFTAAREFYRKLGFENGTTFPDTNTLAMAHAIGIETPTSYDGSQGDHAGGYLLHGEVITLGGWAPGSIDLIEFTIPRTEEPPFQKINHLGMARAVMLTTNIEVDYEYMVEMGVEFIAPPTGRSNGTMFAIFTDLDGTFYELREVEGDDEETDTTHIVALGDLNVNVSDFERSRAWYQMMGYQVTSTLAPTESIEVSNALGFDEKIELDGAVLTHPEDDSTIELTQWLTPYDAEPPYPVPINHFGIHRTAFLTSDIEGDVAALKAQGVEFVSPITPCCTGEDSSGSIVAFYDPDGTIVELAAFPFGDTFFKVMRWFLNTFY